MPHAAAPTPPYGSPNASGPTAPSTLPATSAFAWTATGPPGTPGTPEDLLPPSYSENKEPSESEDAREYIDRLEYDWCVETDPFLPDKLKAGEYMGGRVKLAGRKCDGTNEVDTSDRWAKLPYVASNRYLKSLQPA